MPESIKFNIPSLAEQKAIVAKIEAVEMEIAAANTEEEKAALTQKKFTLMQTLLAE